MIVLQVSLLAIRARAISENNVLLCAFLISFVKLLTLVNVASTQKFNVNIWQQEFSLRVIFFVCLQSMYFHN